MQRWVVFLIAIIAICFGKIDPSPAMQHVFDQIPWSTVNWGSVVRQVIDIGLLRVRCLSH